jgi:hypothetical protein
MRTIFLLTLVTVCSIATAETYDASLFGALKWRSIGPNRFSGQC